MLFRHSNKKIYRKNRGSFTSHRREPDYSSRVHYSEDEDLYHRPEYAEYTTGRNYGNDTYAYEERTFARGRRPSRASRYSSTSRLFSEDWNELRSTSTNGTNSGKKYVLQ